MKEKQKIWGVTFSIWLIIFFIIPFLILSVLSFLKFENYQIINRVTFENYLFIFSSSIYLHSIINSLVIALAVAIITTFFAYLFALYLAFFVYKKYHRALLILIILPLLTNFVLRAFSWRLAFSENGFINRLIESLGFSSINFLFNKYLIIFGIFTYVIPFSIFILYNSLSNINQNLFSVAKNLGGKDRDVFFNIVFSLSKRSLALSLIFSFIISMGDFITPVILGGSKVYTLSLQILDVLRINNIPRAAALGIVMVLISIPFIILFLKLFGGKRDD